MIPKHLKPQRGLGSQVTSHRRRERDRIRRIQSDRDQRRMDIARQELLQASNRLMNSGRQLSYEQALLLSTTVAQTAVMRSYGLRQTIDAGVSWTLHDIMAFTDFNKITVRYPGSAMPNETASNDAKLDAIAAIRGVIQHEMGHLRFTIPFKELVEQGHGELNEIGHTRVAYEYHEDDDTFSYRDVVTRNLHHAWNVLEDQRMETLVVKSVPRISSYLCSMIYTHLLDSDEEGNEEGKWIMFAGRQYLPDFLRSHALIRFIQAHGADKAQQWYDIVEKYKTSTDAFYMMCTVLDAMDFLESLSDQDYSTSEHRDRREPNWWETAEKMDKSPEATPDNACEPSSEDLNKMAGESNDGSGDGSSEPAKSKSSTSDQQSDKDKVADDAGSKGVSEQSHADKDNGSGASATGDHDMHATQSLRDMVRDALNDAVQQQRSDADNKRTLSNTNQRWNSSDGDLPEEPSIGTAFTTEMMQVSNQLTIGIKQALTELETASQPAWQSHQESGIIDALSYRTKQVGALDYHRRLDGEANSGIDLHVSMLSDVSGSMSGDNIQELSVGMYAMRMACDELGITTSFINWSSGAYRVWDEEEVAPVVWSPSGGTDPTDALQAAVWHNERGASAHLIFVFTDGQFGYNVDLSRYSEGERRVILLELGERNPWRDNDSYGADEHIYIKSCLELPDQLAYAIKNLDLT